MKYTILSKEQLENLHEEFSIFLASQSIDKKEWDEIKKNKPELVSKEIQIFSDMVWGKVLKNVKFLEHFTPNHIFLIETKPSIFSSIVISTFNKNIDFCTKEGLDWLEKNWTSDEIIFKTGNKNIGLDFDLEVFDLIKKGANISKGELYNKIDLILNS